MVTTFIRRPGNKSAFLKHIIPLVPKFTGRYIEPFLGSGAVYLSLMPDKAILNDINTDIINIWNLVKTNPEYITKQIGIFKEKFINLTNDDKKKYCKNIVSNMNSYKGDKRTVMYLLMIYCSFNGCIIHKDKFSFSSLNGHIYNGDSCHIFTDSYKTKMMLLKNILESVSVTNKDYKKVLSQAKQGDFVFLDPPYVEDKSYCFKYNKDNSFDIKELKKEVEILNSKNVKWMMTQVDTKTVRDLFGQYSVYTYENKNTYTKKGIIKKEIIITNY